MVAAIVHRFYDEGFPPLSTKCLGSGLLVKNTFLDTSALTDGSRSEETDLRRSQTVGIPGQAASSHEAWRESLILPLKSKKISNGSSCETSCNNSEAGYSAAQSSVWCFGDNRDDDDSVTEALPPSPFGSIDVCGLEETFLTDERNAEHTPQSDGESWSLNVSRTFIECKRAQTPLRRTRSMPNLSSADSGNELAEQYVTVLASKLQRGLRRPHADTHSGYLSPATSWEVSDAAMCFDPQWPMEMVYCLVPCDAVIDDDMAKMWSNPYEQQLETSTSRQHRKNASCKDPAELIAEARRAMAEGRNGIVWEVARKDRDGSFAVQQAIDIVAAALQDAVEQQDSIAYDSAVYDAWALFADLQEHVVDALQHPHANHVIKHIVAVMPTDFIGFVAAELSGKAAWAAKHKYGCRAILRFLRHCGLGSWASGCAEGIIHEILDNAADLCIDAFGKFVLEELLQNGLPEHHQRIATALRGRLVRHAKHKHGSGLIEKLFKFCEQDVCMDIINELTANAETIISLARNQCGMYVLLALVRSPHCTDRVRNSMLPIRSELQRSKRGKSLLESLNNPEPGPALM